MRQTRPLRSISLVTLVLFATATAVPLSAAEPGSTWDLALETTPSVQSLAWAQTVEPVPAEAGSPSGDAFEAAATAVPIDARAAADWRSVDDMALAAAARQDDPDVGQGNRTWRWLKRYWWVPVLVGGAIALAVQDDSPDDGEDDD
jgi:hypothetical protein